MKEASRRNYAVPALDKGLDVLETLAADTTPRSLSGLARQMGRTPSELFRLLTRLEKRRYVVRDPASGTYRLSLKLFELAHTHSPIEHILSGAAGPMRELVESVNESVHLTVISHGDLLVLLDVGSPSRVRFAHEVGGRFSTVVTNSGRLLLAFMSPEDLERHLKENPDYARMNKAERKAFRARLRTIRRNGYAVSRSEERAGMKDIAVLVGNPATGIMAALAIACLGRGRDKADAKRLVEELRERAARITRQLGLTYDRFQVL